MVILQNSSTSKRQLRTSSTLRKARRKNDFGSDWTEQLKQQGLKESKKKEFKWTRKNVKLLIRVHLHRITTILVVGCALGFLWYSSNLFENVTRFSHLTNVERELSLPTDVAFRYSFFKKIAVSPGYMQGLRLVTQDHEQEGKGRNSDDGTLGSGSSFHRYSLSPEAVLAGLYHGLKTLRGWTGFPRTHCKVVSPQGSSTAAFTSHYLYDDARFGVNETGTADNEDEDGDDNESHIPHHKEQDDTDFFRKSCTGLADPLYFYITSARLLESGITILIFFMGVKFGKSILGGLFSFGIFLFLHPQRSNYEWLFPIPEKIGWILVIIQIFTVFRTVYRPVHPSWRSVVKVGIATGALVLGWSTDAQWFLTSQLIITAVLHICGALSRYVASLVILGQLTGWQYASLVSLDPSLHHWSFFMYTLVSCLVTLFVIEPTLDWILGKRNRDKWRFLHGSILLITFQTVLVASRCDLGQVFTFLEDSRFPLTFGDPQEGLKPWILPLDNVSPLVPVTAEYGESAEQEEPGRKNDRVGMTTGGNKLLFPLGDGGDNRNRSDTLLSLQLSEFLRSCFVSGAKSSALKFLGRNFFLILAGLYAVLVAVLIPLLVAKSKNERRKLKEFSSLCGISRWSSLYSSSILREVLQREDDDGDDEEDGDEESAVSPSGASSSSSGGWSSEDDDNNDKSQGKFHFPHSSNSNGTGSNSNNNNNNNNDYSRRGRESKPRNSASEKLWRWDSFLTYHIAQTLFFGLFCLWLDKRWEMFFVPHVSLLLTLLCDFRKISRILKKSPFSYAVHVHWGVVIGMVGILVASARLRSNSMFQRSRGRFEIGNPRVESLMEALKWIRENTESSAGFAGADNLMVALDLSAGRHPVNHHLLTVHSWSNGNELELRRQRLYNEPALSRILRAEMEGGEGKGEGQRRKPILLKEETMEQTPPPPSPVYSRQALSKKARSVHRSISSSVEVDEDEDEEADDGDEDDERDSDGKNLRSKSLLKGSVKGLPSQKLSEAGSEGSKPPGHEEDLDHNRDGESLEPRMSSFLTASEVLSLVKVYSIFSRSKTMFEFHQDLNSLDVSFLLISQEMCSSESGKGPTRGSNPLSTNISPPSPLTTSSSRARTGGGGGGSSKTSNNNPYTSSSSSSGSRGGPSIDSAQIFFRPEHEEIEQLNSSISGTWQWQWNWQEPALTQESPLASSSALFPKRCDFLRFWYDIEKRPGDNSDPLNSEEEEDVQNSYCSQYKSCKPPIIRPNNDFKAQRMDEARGKQQEDIEDLNDTLCTRLLYERNILPFRKVFQNLYFAILAV